MKKLITLVVAVVLTSLVAEAEAVWIEGTTRVHSGGRQWLVPAAVQVIEDRTGRVMASTVSGQRIWLGSWVDGYTVAAPDGAHLSVAASWRDPQSGVTFRAVQPRAVFGRGGRAVVHLNLKR